MNSAKTPKHIVLISLDTLRGDCVAAEGTKGYYLPNELKDDISFSHTFLDELAGKSMHYSRCFSSAPYTTASHASIFTGLFPLRHGLYEYYNSQINSKTVFESAKELGRHVIFKTDFPVILGKPLGFTRGVDDYVVEDDGKCLELLEKHCDESTLDFIHFGGIHYPYGFHTAKIAGPDYLKKIVTLEQELNIQAQDMPADQMDETYRDDVEKALLFRYKHIVETFYAQKNYQRLTELYIEGISYFIDHRFKQFFEKLTSIYDMKETKIYIFGDHGEEWSPTSEGHYKTLSRGVLQVPLLVCGAGVKPGLVDAHVRTVDIGANVLSDLGITANGLDGKVLPENAKAALVENERSAVAQTWLGIGKDALQKHIDDAQKKGRVEQNIPTRKRGETVIAADYQFLRLYDRDGCKKYESLLEIETGTEVVNESVQKQLETWLATYNAEKTNVKSEAYLDENMKELLRLQGYNI